MALPMPTRWNPRRPPSTFDLVAEVASATRGAYRSINRCR